LLAEHYLRAAAVRCGRSKLKFTPAALEALQRYRWPGNVRELKNLTERLAVLCPREELGPEELPSEFHGAPPACAPAPAPAAAAPAPAGAGSPPAAEAKVERSLEEVEREHIRRVLAACGGNKKKAAEVLGIDRGTLHAKLRAYGEG
jgi:DNA-binding NtrC family response regulator